MRNFNKMLAVLVVVSSGGCSSLPLDIPVNPNVPDLRTRTISPSERTSFAPDPDRAKATLTDTVIDRGGLADVLLVAPTQ